ncbi:hypothetical protein M406DRAFT_344698 [Cryphonectria parasitica EP155]|uniref:BTB domain-containing protein n=1 Tax=Cryphonectria parasitica (strain ATCC 38755 / EP155) TaxID=660469 RepID=A0A9P5CRT0_CRYP1|nr:uncharacterized protein M406DRAFT_344698 [Cryphonectria parasitica EP155]KAF3768573.1 hypothetical protein M406DRAFT_344698 [Cryphonectria parasitica EP155]
MGEIFRKHELEAKLKDENQLIASGVLRDENPLDQSSEFAQFLEACRRGDLKTCQELMSVGVNINGKDKFDYTPLIVASLCGHLELVQLLLEAGALAERDTFQGERAVYNALNDRIRKLLLSYDYAKSSDPLQPWSSHITSLMTKDTPKTSDITLSCGSDDLHLHKFLLSSRTPYFRQKLEDTPETTHWKLSSAVPAEAIRLVVRYLYLGEMPRDLVDARSTTTEEQVFKGIDKISKQLEVEKLWEAVLSMDDRRLARQRHQDEVERAQSQVEAFFQNKVLGHKMRVDTDKLDKIKWKPENSIFADCLVRADEDDEEEWDEEVEESKNETASRAAAPDGATAILIGRAAETSAINGNFKPRKSVVYPVHKAMLIRSPYFETMFSSEFLEAQDSEYLHIVKVDCIPEVLEIVLQFMYTEKADCPLHHALELLYTADMLLMDKLKSRAAVAISTLGSATRNILVDRTHTNDPDADTTETEPINIYDVIHAAWDLRVQRLEEFAARYLAHRLEDYIDEPEFAELIQESASRVKDRQETDTIELLDDIRYYLSERFRLRFEDTGFDDWVSDGEPEDKERPDEVGKNGLAADPKAAQGTTTLASDSTVQQVPAAQTGIVRTLDGEEVDDEFDLDAQNYQILLRKIDDMLVRLQLDA